MENKNKTRKRKSYLWIIFALLVVAIFWTVVFLVSEKENEKVYTEEGEAFRFFENTDSNNIEQAKKNAKNYIKYKYGFSPKIKSVLLDKYYHEWASKTGYAYVKAEYKGKEFNIIVPSNRQSIKAADDYQKEEIKKDIVDILKKDVGEPYSYSVEYTSFINEKLKEDEMEGYSNIDCINEYYDGTNLIDIINNNKFNVFLSYLEDVNLKRLEKLETNPIFNCDVNIGIGKFKSKEIYDISNIQISNISVWGKLSEKCFVKYAMYMEEGFLQTIKENEKVKKYYKFDIKEYDGLYFYSENIDNLKIEKVSEDSVKWETSDCWKKAGENYMVTGIEGKLYIFTKSEEELWLFIESEEKNVEDREYGLDAREYRFFETDIAEGSWKIRLFKYNKN